MESADGKWSGWKVVRMESGSDGKWYRWKMTYGKCRRMGSVAGWEMSRWEIAVTRSDKVIVDDKGIADCEGEITYTSGDLGLNYCRFDKPQSLREIPKRFMKNSFNPRLFCGYFTCTGTLKLVCDGMLGGCHGK